MHDLVIRNGFIIDGSGAPGRTGDVAIKDGLIAEVTAPGAAGRGAEEIDAKGLLVTPGFVDIHTHYDAQVTWDAQLTPSSWHGCTTVVMGSCGVGFAPAAPDRHDWLIGLMEGVEDIPGAAMHEGIKWGWETFPEYLDVIGSTPHAIDFAAQIPHGPVRGYVMGDRGAANEPATPDDIARMKAIVKEGLLAGALGFSTSRTLLHKSIDGVPVPGTFAERAELFGIGEALGETGLGVFQLAAEHTQAQKEFEWMRELAMTTKRPVMFNLSQTDIKPRQWREMLALLEDARKEGIPVFGQVAGRAIGILMTWEGTAHPFARHPTWLAMQDLTRAERKLRLKDPAVRQALLTEKQPQLTFFEKFITTAFHKMYLFDAGCDYEPAPERSIASIAKATGRAPLEIAYDALMEEDGDAMLYFPLFNYADQNLEVLRELHMHPQTIMGLSDGGAHCGAVCDGGMPTFMLTHWARDRTRGERIPLEYIIARQTRQTAAAFGLMDRGLLVAGMKADVNIIDFDRLGFAKPKLVWDLPANGRRLIQRAHGYRATICSGVVISRDDTPTGALPGQLIRGPQGTV